MVRAAILPLLCAFAVCANAPAEAPRRGLWIGGIHVCRDTVASVVLSGEREDYPFPELLITLRPQWRAALEMQTTRLYNRPMPVRLNGRTILAPMVREPITGGVMALSGPEPRELERVRAAALSGC